MRNIKPRIKSINMVLSGKTKRFIINICLIGAVKNIIGTVCNYKISAVDKKSNKIAFTARNVLTKVSKNKLLSKFCCLPVARRRDS